MVEVGYLKCWRTFYFYFYCFSFTFCDSIFFPFFFFVFATPRSSTRKPSSHWTEQITLLLFCHRVILCVLHNLSYPFCQRPIIWDLQPGKFEHGWHPGNPSDLYSSCYLCLAGLPSDSPGKLPSLLICLGRGKKIQTKNVMHIHRKTKTEVHTCPFIEFHMW